MVYFLYFSLTLLIIFLLYPVFLLFLPTENKTKEKYEIDNVTLILFSFNNACYLRAKIDALCKELSSFTNYEFIIIENGSTDGSLAILDNYKNIEHLKVIQNSVKGVAGSINMGVKIALYDYVIFCDLRQKMSKNILKNLVEPFKNKKVGAVSSCISSIDSKGKKSVLRLFENFIKTQESKKGCLIGVYGPLYAIRKKCFEEISGDILLEDMYLSLAILSTHAVVMNNECIVTDEQFTEVYNYKRVKDYLKGLKQLTKSNVFNRLCYKHLLMLIWHKYVRLLIPFLSVIIIVGVFFIAKGIFFNMALFTVSMLTFLMIIPGSLPIQQSLRNLFKINMYYIAAFFELLFKKAFYKCL